MNLDNFFFCLVSQKNKSSIYFGQKCEEFTFCWQRMTRTNKALEGEAPWIYFLWRPIGYTWFELFFRFSKLINMSFWGSICSLKRSINFLHHKLSSQLNQKHISLILSSPSTSPKSHFPSPSHKHKSKAHQVFYVEQSHYIEKDRKTKVCDVFPNYCRFDHYFNTINLNSI